MRILLTNDDGISSPGLWAAARGLTRVGHLTVIGTTTDYSACGAAIMLSRGTKLRRHLDVPADMKERCEAYSIDAAPGAAVIAGLMSGLFEPFDLVASGTNLGLNIGLDMNHSGTLGAAITAWGRGMSAFAISIERGFPQRWETSSIVAERVATWFAETRPQNLLLNVNVPNRDATDLRGATLTGPVRWGNLDRSSLQVDRDGADAWVIRGWVDRAQPYPDEAGTDSGAVRAGEVSITRVFGVLGAPPDPQIDVPGLELAVMGAVQPAML